MIRRILCFLVIAVAGCQRPKEAVVIPAQVKPCRTVTVTAYEGKTYALAAMYEDKDMTIPVPNPQILSCYNDVEFWVAGNSRVVIKEQP